MRDRVTTPIPQRMRRCCFGVLGAALLALFCLLLAPTSAQAQAILRVTVRNATTQAPVPRANVRLSSETERTQVKGADANGLAVFENLTPGPYAINASAVGFVAKDATATVAADAPTEVTILLTPTGTTTIKIIDEVRIINPREVSNYAARDQQFFRDFPLYAGNRQDLSKILTSVPGMVPDSLHRTHPRGEDSYNKATYLNGFLLPQYLAGSAIPFILPEYVGYSKQYNGYGGMVVKTGGLEPRYGGGSGAILDIDLMATPVLPTIDYTLRAGGYGTTELFLTFGDNLPAPGTLFRRGRSRTPVDPRTVDRPFAYMITLSQRYTDNGLEPPQPGKQTVNNNQASELFFGKVDYRLNPRATLHGIFNFASGRTNLADRTGLDNSYAAYGQGFGYGGLSSSASGLPSQQTLGQNFLQKDNNNLTLIQMDAKMKNGGTALYSIGATRSDLAIVNRSRPQSGGLPVNSSYEFSPSLRQSHDQTSVQLDFVAPVNPRVLPEKAHAARYGLVYQSLDAREAYQLIPGSLAALEVLANTDPRLVRPNDAPIVTVKRTGSYGAIYAQDTFRPFSTMTFNYGVRVDTYNQSANVNSFTTQTGDNLSRSTLPSVSRTEFSPRVNVAIELPKNGRLRFLSQAPTVIRASYDRLFTPPSLGQGVFAGNRQVAPQTVDQYDAGIERQFGSNKIGKIALYSKDVKNALAHGQLVPGTEATGIVSTFNLGNAQADGVEVSFELLPNRAAKSATSTGVHAYLTYTNGSVKPTNRNQRDSLNRRIVTPDLEVEQLDTLNLGAAYNTASGASAGLTMYYGSGLYSSALALAAGPNVQSPVRSNSRESTTEVNLKLSSGQRFLRKTTAVQLDVENLFDGRSRLNFASMLTGTRFQQGRRVFLTVTGKF